MDMWSLITVVIFMAFIGISLLMFLPTADRRKPYENAEKLALKEEGDAPVTPRHHSSDKRTKT